MAFASGQVATFILPTHILITSPVIKGIIVTVGLLCAQPMSVDNFKSQSCLMVEQDLNTETLVPELINLAEYQILHLVSIPLESAKGLRGLKGFSGPRLVS